MTAELLSRTEAFSKFLNILEMGGAETTSPEFCSHTLFSLLPELYSYPSEEEVAKITGALLAISAETENQANILLGYEDHLETLVFVINTLFRRQEKQQFSKILVSCSNQDKIFQKLAQVFGENISFVSEKIIPDEDLGNGNIDVILVNDPELYTPEEILALCEKAQEHSIQIVINGSTTDLKYLADIVDNHSNLTIVKSLPEIYEAEGLKRSWIISNIETKEKLDIAKVRDESLAMTDIVAKLLTNDGSLENILNSISVETDEDLSKQLLIELLKIEKKHNEELSEENILVGTSTTTNLLRLVFQSLSEQGKTILSESTAWPKFELLADAIERKFSTIDTSKNGLIKPELLKKAFIKDPSIQLIYPPHSGMQINWIKSLKVIG